MGLSIVLWVLQVLLAAQFLFHGFLYVAPPSEMADQMNAMIAPWFRTFIGVAEILAAIGLILPGVTRVLPWATPLAALGLMIVTGSATVLHLARGEPGSAAYVAMLFVLVTFVGYMRWRVRPIEPRGESRPGHRSSTARLTLSQWTEQALALRSIARAQHST